MISPRIYITEYHGCATDQHGRLIPVPAGQPVNEQAFNLTDRSQVADAFDERTTLLEISATVPFCIDFGETPEARATHHRIAANTAYSHGVKRGERLAFILSEDAMQMIGPSGGASGVSGTDSLKNAIDMLANPKATAAAIESLQKAEKSSQTAAKTARDAENALAEQRQTLKAWDEALAQREAQLRSATNKLAQDQILLGSATDKLVSERAAFEKDVEQRRKSIDDDVTRANDNIGKQTVELSAQKSAQDAEHNSRTTALAAQIDAHQAREKAMTDWEQQIASREHQVRAVEKALAAKLKQLAAAGIHVQSETDTASQA